MIITEQAQRAINYLRNAPESDRARGAVMWKVSGKKCACAMLAKPLGIPISPNTYTPDLILKIADAMNVPEKIVAQVPQWNDSRCRSKVNGKPNGISALGLGLEYTYTFAEIADKLEESIRNA